MKECLQIKNWEKFQHYKDRNPPWIKLHRELLDDYNFSRLQDASKAHLMLIWVLASQLENQIPNDPEWIKRKIGAIDDIDLKELVEKGFLVMGQDASTALAKCSPETEAETYREETEKNSIQPHDVSLPVWRDFVKHRRAKKSPISPTVLTRIRNEADKAGWSMEAALSEMCARGWQGFKAEWVTNNGERNGRPSKQSRLEQASNAAIAEMFPEDEQTGFLAIGNVGSPKL